nr:hypothetical protein [Deltaproteobacteria bacterium]
MRRLVTALCLAAASCGDEPGASEVQRYLTDRAFRRAELVASLTTTDNDYARLRLARYDTADARDWSLRPVWNPPAAPLVPAATPLRPLDLPASTDRASLLSLGEAAFSRYPAMLASTTVEATLRAPGAAARYGFWTSADGHVGGLVRVALADGTVGLAYSCATCHRAPDAEGNAVPGSPMAPSTSERSAPTATRPSPRRRKGGCDAGAPAASTSRPTTDESPSPSPTCAP